VPGRIDLVFCSDLTSSSFAEIRARPDLRRVFDPPARRHFGPIFPYGIVYLDQTDTIWIVAIMHFKQEPGYWRKRLG
jgi:hypothetical protein